MTRRIDLNSADLATLVQRAGLNPRKAALIINRRPFWVVEEVGRLPGFGPKTMSRLAKVATVVPPPPVDLNTCSLAELTSLPGVGPTLARRIIAARPFASVAELARVEGVGKSLLARLSRQTLATPAVTRTAQRPGQSAERPGGRPQAAVRGEAGGEPRWSQPEPAPRPVSSGVLIDGEWLSVDDPEFTTADDAAPLPQVRSAVMSLVEHDRAVRGEIMRRMPVFVSGWVTAAILLVGIVLLYGLGLVRLGPERPVQAADDTTHVQELRATVQSAIEATLAFTPHLIPSPSPVIIPPTPTLALPTQTPAHTPSPALDYMTPLAHLGPLIFTETFSPGNYWELETTDIARTSIELDRLNMALFSRAAIAWSRNGFGGSDFYYQGTVLPERCQAGDYYGLVFRSVDDFNLYLFGISCNGEYRVVRKSESKFTVLVDFTPAPGALPGDQLNLLGVRAAGTELHFYVNDQHLTGITDAGPREGRFGVFAKSLMNPALVVYFDDLSAWSIAP